MPCDTPPSTMLGYCRIWGSWMEWCGQISLVMKTKKIDFLWFCSDCPFPVCQSYRVLDTEAEESSFLLVFSKVFSQSSLLEPALFIIDTGFEGKLCCAAHPGIFRALELSGRLLIFLSRPVVWNQNHVYFHFSESGSMALWCVKNLFCSISMADFAAFAIFAPLVLVFRLLLCSKCKIAASRHRSFSVRVMVVTCFYLLALSPLLRTRLTTGAGLGSVVSFSSCISVSMNARLFADAVKGLYHHVVKFETWTVSFYIVHLYSTSPDILTVRIYTGFVTVHKMQIILHFPTVLSALAPCSVIFRPEQKNLLGLFFCKMT